MSSTETVSAPTVNGVSGKSANTPSFEFVSRLGSLPVVADSLGYAQSTINAHPLLSQTYQLGNNVIVSTLKVAEPFTARLQPQLQAADSYACKGLDYAESKAPIISKPTGDLIAQARVPADQARAILATYGDALLQAYHQRLAGPAKDVYDARVAPVYGSAQQQFQELKNQNAYLQKASDAIVHLQANLAETIKSISSRGKQDTDEASKKAQSLSNSILAELDRVRSFAISLPAEGRKRVSPVLETFNGAYENLAKQAKASDVPAEQRFRNLLNYVGSQFLPALQKAIVSPEQASSTPNGNGKARAETK